MTFMGLTKKEWQARIVQASTGMHRTCTFLTWIFCMIIIVIGVAKKRDLLTVSYPEGEFDQYSVYFLEVCAQKINGPDGGCQSMAESGLQDIIRELSPSISGLPGISTLFCLFIFSLLAHVLLTGLDIWQYWDPASYHPKYQNAGAFIAHVFMLSTAIANSSILYNYQFTLRSSSNDRLTADVTQDMIRLGFVAAVISLISMEFLGIATLNEIRLIDNYNLNKELDENYEEKVGDLNSNEVHESAQNSGTFSGSSDCSSDDEKHPRRRYRKSSIDSNETDLYFPKEVETQMSGGSSNERSNQAQSHEHQPREVVHTAPAPDSGPQNAQDRPPNPLPPQVLQTPGPQYVQGGLQHPQPSYPHQQLRGPGP